MVLGASLAALGLSAGSIVLFGTAVSPLILEVFAVFGVGSAFVAICSAEAQASG